MAYISLENIKHVFPCVSLPERQNSRLMSEENITNIIKSISDRPSYIIEYIPDTITSGTLRFVLDGYYFEIANFELTGGNKFARISYKENSDFKLIKSDGTTDFTGLEIHNSAPADGDYLALCVDNKIPPSSYIKFSSASLELNHINCGELK